MTFVQLAKTYSKYLATAKRDNGKEYIHLKDGAPEALTDLVREAHDAGGHLMMPDDYRYEMVREALDTIAELDADADEDAARDRLAEVEPPIYTVELTAWLASRVDRYVYCDEAAEEYGQGLDTIQRIALGWLAEFREVAESVLCTLINQADAALLDGEIACECGEATGEQCQWTGPRAETVLVEWMPPHLRASHAAAGNTGSYPANGALRLRVHRACAELLTHEPTKDGEIGEPSPWARIVEVPRGQ